VLKDSKILWVTRTAAFIALLLTAQGVSGAFGQYVTGSLVNLILAVSVIAGGLGSGIVVALASPIFAFLLGIGPALLPIIPFMMLGNLSLVLVWHWIGSRRLPKKPLLRYYIAAVGSAVIKPLVLYLGIVRLAIPIFLNVSEQQAAVLSTTFSLPQVVTAAIGGLVAANILPLLKKVVTPRPEYQ